MAELNARIIAKASATAAEEPLAADLEVAELAVNTADGKLFTKHTDGSVVTISGGGGSSVSSLSDLDDVDNNLPSPNGDLLYSNDGEYRNASISVLLSGRDAVTSNVASAITNDTNMAGINGFYADNTALENDGFTALAANNIDDGAISIPDVAWQDYAQIDWVGQPFSNLYKIKINSNGSVYLDSTDVAIAGRSGTFASIHSSVAFVAAWTVEDTETRLGGYKEITQDGTDWFVVRIDMKVPYSSDFTGYPFETWFGKDGRIRQYFGDKIGSSPNLQTGPTLQGLGSYGATLTDVTGLNPFGGQRIEYTAPSYLYALPGAKLEDLSDVNTPSDGGFLTYDAATLSWSTSLPAGGGGAVDSVNGQTGVVSLGIQDMDDFELKKAGAFTWAVQDSAAFASGMTDGGAYVNSTVCVISPVTEQGDQKAELRAWSQGLSYPTSFTFILDGVSVVKNITGIDDDADETGSYNPRFIITTDAPFGDQPYIGQTLEIEEFTDYASVVTLPLANGDILQWSDAGQKFKPVQLTGGGGGAVDSVNGETGVVSLGIQDMDDYELNQSPLVFSWASYTTTGSAALNVNEWWSNTGNLVVSTITSTGDQEAALTGLTGFEVTITDSTGATFTFTPSSVSVDSNGAGGIRRAILSGDFSSSDDSAIDKTGGISLASSGLGSADVLLVEGDILQWSNTDQKFKPAQLPTGGAVDSVNSQTGVVSLGIQDMDDFELSADATYTWPNKIQSGEVAGDRDCPNPGDWAGYTSATLTYIYLYNDSVAQQLLVGETVTLTLGTGESYTGVIQSNTTSQPSWTIAFGRSAEISVIASAGIGASLTIDFSSAVANSLANGDILQWNDTDQKFKPVQLTGGGGGAVDSVNGETGVVSLGIQDMDDFELNANTGFVYRRWAVVAVDQSGTTASDQPGEANIVISGSGVFANNTDSDGNDFKILVDTAVAANGGNMNGITIYSSRDGSSTWTTHTGDVVSSDWLGNGEAYLNNLSPILAETADELFLSFINPSLPPSPLADGDILQWVDADQKFKPSSDYVLLTSLKAETAASTDFADFQARIAAL